MGVWDFGDIDYKGNTGAIASVLVLGASEQATVRWTMK